VSYSEFCPHFQEAIELIGRRWSGAVTRALLDGPRRFSELTRAIPEITDRGLSQRLKELELEGIVERKVSPTSPPQVSYELTEKGSALQAAIDQVERWAHDWVMNQDPGQIA
jgi:DNA-binding HxlR family transcriptional regulator